MAEPFPDGPASPASRPEPLALHWRILIGVLVGAALGLTLRVILPPAEGATVHPRVEWLAKNVAEPLGQVFLRLIFMVVIPLVFSALSLAIVEIGDVRRLGKLGLYTLLATVVLSSTSVFLGIGLANTIQPGKRLEPAQRAELAERFQAKAESTVAVTKSAKSVRDTLLDLIPKNPLQEMVGAIDGSSPGGGMLAVMFFSVAVGLAITVVPQRTGALVGVLEGVYDVSMAIIGFAMKLAPWGVAGLMFSLTATLGIDILSALLTYVITVLAGLAIQAGVVYSLFVSLVGGRNPLAFARGISEAILTAFASSSSSATLPTAIRVTEQNLGVRPEIARFVLTVGATANQNGTALYEGITVLFLAQVFGVELTWAQQIVVVLMSILAGIGTAGVPGGSLPLVVLVLQSVGVPGEGIAIILGVDRLLDMCRTTLNVSGDIAIATAVDRLSPHTAT